MTKPLARIVPQDVTVSLPVHFIPVKGHQPEHNTFCPDADIIAGGRTKRHAKRVIRELVYKQVQETGVVPTPFSTPLMADEKYKMVSFRFRFTQVTKDQKNKEPSTQTNAKPFFNEAGRSA